jgi:predicted restriction endonuclease
MKKQKKIKKITKKKLKKLERIAARKKLEDWSRKVKERDNNSCVICGESKMLNSHHIIPKEVKGLKFDIMNGICLCAKHHQFSRQLSAHSNSFVFIVWLQENRRGQFDYLKSKYLNTGYASEKQEENENDILPYLKG